MINIIKFSASDNAFLAFWLVHSISVISSYTLVWPYMENDCASVAELIYFFEVESFSEKLEKM